MWRKLSCAAGGLALACAAALSLTLIESNARTANFDLRWLYPATKQDRLPITQLAPLDHVVMGFNVPSESTTIVTKGPIQRRVESSIPHKIVRPVAITPVRDVPSGDSQDQEKAKARERIPEGCEPSFSPVTTPAFAHVSTRCDS